MFDIRGQSEAFLKSRGKESCRCLECKAQNIQKRLKLSSRFDNIFNDWVLAEGLVRL
jgi:hypothetical protein